MGAFIFAGGDPSKVDVSGYNKGDILAADSSGVLQVVPIGISAEVLTVDPLQPESLIYDPSGGAGSGDVTGPLSSVDQGVARFNGITGKFIQDGSGVTLDGTGFFNSVGGLVLDQTVAPTWARGKLVYDTDPEAETITFFNVETETEIHFGRELQLPARNSGAATILAGQAVYINGNHPGTKLPTIALAQANNATTAACIGIAAHDIEVNTIGYVYAIGLADHNINTNPWNNGDLLYLSDSVAGGLTSTAPTAASSYVVFIGIVTRKAAANSGALYINVGFPRPAVSAVSTKITLGAFNTSGNVTCANGLPYTQIDSDLSIPAVVNDYLGVSIQAVINDTGAELVLDMATRVSGADVNYLSSGTGTPRFNGALPPWLQTTIGTGNFPTIEGEVLYKVQAGDLSAGTVTLRPYGAGDGGTRAVIRSAAFPLRCWVKNYGQGT